MTVQHHEMKPQWWQTLLKGDYLSKRPRRGDICEATILAIGEHDILVELAGKRDGLIQREDLAGVDDAYLSKLKVGDCIPVRVVRVPYERSAILVSLKQGLQQQEWMQIKTLQESQEIIEVEVLEVNRGGLVAVLGGLRGFIPNSHLVAVPRGMRGWNYVEHPRDVLNVGDEVEVYVLGVDRERERISLSRKHLLPPEWAGNLVIDELET
jgi:small subunit ribosomal protein S1